MDSNEVNRVDVGLQLGVGVGLQTGPGALLLDVRSVLGLTNFEKSAGGKSRTVALTLGYALPIGN